MNNNKFYQRCFRNALSYQFRQFILCSTVLQNLPEEDDWTVERRREVECRVGVSLRSSSLAEVADDTQTVASSFVRVRRAGSYKRDIGVIILKYMYSQLNLSDGEKTFVFVFQLSNYMYMKQLRLEDEEARKNYEHRIACTRLEKAKKQDCE